MADNKTYVIGESKSIFEGMTKEEILAAIVQAVQSGTIRDIDTGFITKIKEINSGQPLQFWVGTSAEYNALAADGKLQNNVLYIKTDDTSAADISAELAAHDSRLTSLENKIYIPVGGVLMTSDTIASADDVATVTGFGTWTTYGTLTTSAYTVNCWLRTA